MNSIGEPGVTFLENAGDGTFSELLVDASEEPAIVHGVGWNNDAYINDGAGGFSKLPVGGTWNSQAVFPPTENSDGTSSNGNWLVVNSRRDYSVFAHETGGYSWDFAQFRFGDATVQSSFTSSFVDGKVNEIVAQVPIDIQASILGAPFENLTGMQLGAENDTLTFQVELTGDGGPHSFDLEFVRAGSQIIIGNLPVTINGQYFYDADAIDPDDDELTYELIGDDHGATFDPVTAELVWTPPGTPLGAEYDFTLRVTDGRGGEDIQTWTVTVDSESTGNNDPVLADVDPIDAEVSRPLAVYLDGSDVDGDALRYQLIHSPADGYEVVDGMDIDSQTGVFTWTPPAFLTDQTITVLARATDGRGGYDDTEIVISIIDADTFNNQKPTIDSTAPTEATQGERYTYQVDASDPDADPLIFEVVLAPFGMAIDEQTGLIVWEPTFDQVGTHDVILRVRDDFAGVALQKWAITVASENYAPEIVSTPPAGPTGPGLDFEYQVEGQDANGDTLEYSLDSTSLATGLSIDAVTGLVTWTPTASDISTHTITVTVTEPDRTNPKSTDQTFTLEVQSNPTNHTPVIGSNPRTRVREGRTYVYFADASDQDGDAVSYSLSNQPAGMQVDANGVVTWDAPIGNLTTFSNIVLTVDDGRPNGIATQQWDLEVVGSNSNDNPEITSTPRYNATLDKLYTYNLTTDDADGDPIDYILVKGPTGMSLSPTLGTIRWTPDVQHLGEQPIVIRAVDPLGGFDTQSFTITVRALNLPPNITSVPSTSAELDVEYTYSVIADDPENDPVTVTATRTAVNGSTGNISMTVTGNVVSWTPTGTDDIDWLVTVTATDDSGDTNTQTYTLVVTDGTGAADLPPVITSQAVRIASVADSYQYQVAGNDPDGPGITWSVTEKPNFFGDTGEVDLAINSSTGLITWTPSDSHLAEPAIHYVTVVANSGGKIASQRYQILVRPQNTDPDLLVPDTLTVTAGREYRYDLQVTNDDLDPIDFTLDSGPVGMELDGFGRLRWNTEIADINSHPVTITISDGRGGTDTKTFNVVVEADLQDPEGGIVYSPEQPRVDEPITIYVSAVDNVGVASITLTVDGNVVGVDGQGVARTTVTTAGIYTMVATIVDEAGNSTQVTEDLPVYGDGDYPTLEITTPTNREVVTEPTTIIGTIDDDDLTYYRVDVLTREGGLVRTITEVDGNGTVIDAVTNGDLGLFDPTSLDNGSYVIRITADDLDPGNGGDIWVDRVVSVDSNLKLGNFSLSFTDLTIPVAGIPITVNRVYDTLRAHEEGDFGYGWRLAIGEFDVEVDYQDGSMSGFGVYPPFRDGTRVTITMEDGTTQGYTFEPWEEVRSYGTVRVWHPRFVADGDHNGFLKVDDQELTKVGDEYISYAAGGVSYNPANPAFGGSYDHFSSGDGFKRELHATTGDLLSMADRHGNKLTYTDTAITSSEGRSLDLERDYRGRIISIVEPRGYNLSYEYDLETGNLVSFTDRTGNSTIDDPNDNTTQYVYYEDNVGAPEHFMQKIIDPLGRETVITTFNTENRLEQLTDAQGYDMGFDYDTTSVAGEYTINSSEELDGGLTADRAVTLDSRGNPIRLEDAETGIGTLQYAYDPGSDPNSDEDDTLISITPVQVVGEEDAGGTETNDLVSVTMLDDDLNVDVQTDIRGNQTLFTYNEARQVTSQTDPQGNTTQFFYSAFDGEDDEGFPRGGDLIMTVDPNDQATAFEYEARGLVSVVLTGREYNYWALDSFQQQLEFDPNCDPLTEPACNPWEREDVVRTEFDYNDYGDVFEVRSDAGRTTNFDYDEIGNQIESSYVDAINGSNYRILSTSTFDPEARGDGSSQVKITDPDGAGETTETLWEASNSYDQLGQVDTTTDQFDNLTETLYDNRGQAIQSRSQSFDSDGNEHWLISWTVYDESGRAAVSTSSVIEGSNETLWASRSIYDKEGRVVRSEQLKNPVIAITGEDDDIQTVLQSEGTIISFTTTQYDELGRVTISTNRFGAETHNTYNVFGEVAETRSEVEDENGTVVWRVTRTVYDDQGRAYVSTDPFLMSTNGTVLTGTIMASMTIYDVLGRAKETQRLEGVTVDIDSEGTTSLINDGDVISLSRSYWNDKGQLERTETLGQELQENVDPVFREMTYEYDDFGRSSQLSITLSTLAE